MLFKDVSTKILSSTAVFNIHKKCFLSSKSAYYNDFWKIMWQSLIIFYNTTVFTALFIYKCSLENFFKKIKTNRPQTFVDIPKNDTTTVYKKWI